VTTIGNLAFENCDSLVSVRIPSSVARIGYKAFCDCKSLTTANYPAGWVENIGYGSYPTMYGCIFAGCPELKKLIVPEG
jgi:hypothetical protein